MGERVCVCACVCAFVCVCVHVCVRLCVRVCVGGQRVTFSSFQSDTKQNSFEKNDLDFFSHSELTT